MSKEETNPKDVKDYYIKESLIKKHLGINTPAWIIKNCISLLDEYSKLISKEGE
ncbi:MAG: hypothetical protein V3V00_15880 [Saprospiraceae bacterium]